MARGAHVVCLQKPLSDFFLDMEKNYSVSLLHLPFCCWSSVYLLQSN